MVKSSKSYLFIVAHACLFFSNYGLPPLVREQCVSSHVDSSQIIDSFFFTPDEAYTLKQILVGLIDAEKTMIQLALFRLTDHDIAQALIDAHKRGVAIELIIDAGGVDLGHYSKVSALAP